MYDARGMPWRPHLQVLLFAIMGAAAHLGSFTLQSTCRFPLADGCCDAAEGDRSWRDATRRLGSHAPTPIKASKPTAQKG
jgi:hypothetical protein